MSIVKQILFSASAANLPSGSVAVVSNFYAGLFGGPLSQLIKCLTAVKVCAEFEKNGTAAVPVCLVRQDAPLGFSPIEITLIDRGSGLHYLKSSGMEVNTAEAVVDVKNYDRLFGEIEKIFPDGDREALLAMKEAFYHDAESVSSCARWLKYMLKDFGAIVVEHDALPQNPPFPVAAFVADSSEISEYANEATLHERDDATRPIIWPLPDVTISNVRIMKTLRHYELDISRIFDGKEQVMDYARGTLKSDVPDRLQKLLDETVAVLDELERSAFSEPCEYERSVRIRKARSARIVYQIKKIHKHTCAALAEKEKTAENRIRKACDFLSPFGRWQQNTLGCAQVPISHGRAGLRALYERLDITTQNHQLIEMD